ncbi:hypothetical protein APHAL10511_000918 [Amanita phalloides]|nr:hypothetical protein APHAL10511_000918 [Amanita phalloides]
MLCLKLPLHFLTLGLPGFYESLATGLGGSVLSFGIISSTSDQVRKFSSTLLTILVATLFKPSVEYNDTFWFFISSSLILVAMGLVCSTILVIVYGRFENEHHSVDVASLDFLCWNVWDLSSFPTICTAWGTITFIIALITDAMHPSVSGNDAGEGSCFMAAKVALLLLISFAALRFGFFLLHVRRLSNALGQSVNEEHA